MQRRTGGSMVTVTPRTVRGDSTAQSGPKGASGLTRLGHIESGFVGGVFVGVPAGDVAGAEHVVGEACDAVAGVGVEGELEVLVCFGSSAFPPVDV
ncbi:hypothetical protein PJL15_01264 [Paenarthrobacter nitroguajacolicus]|nr:hypothetical protein [Paenarthrobacter nitroguajacolicus]